MDGAWNMMAQGFSRLGVGGLWLEVKKNGDLEWRKLPKKADPDKWIAQQLAKYLAIVHSDIYSEDDHGRAKEV